MSNKGFSYRRLSPSGIEKAPPCKYISICKYVLLPAIPSAWSDAEASLSCKLRSEQRKTIEYGGEIGEYPWRYSP